MTAIRIIFDHHLELAFFVMLLCLASMLDRVGGRR